MHSEPFEVLKDAYRFEQKRKEAGFKRRKKWVCEKCFQAFALGQAVKRHRAECKGQKG